MARGLLEGARVLDLASVGPSARASRWLADYGAEVVKVGPVPGDQVQIAPPFHAYSAHRGMSRALFDLKAPEGRAAFLKLAATADVVLESFRPGVVARLGVGFEDVRAVNPGIVYCSTTGYGQDGPNCLRAGHDLNYLAATGYLGCSTPGQAGRPPLPGATIADSAGGGMHAVIAILAALVGRHHTGQGAYLDVSVADGMLAIMALQIDEYLATGTFPEPGHGMLTGRYACYGVYRCGDGRWLSLAAIEPRFWANLCRELGLPQWIDHQTDDDAQIDIRRDIERVLGTRDRDAWIVRLGPADTCVAPVSSVPEVVDDEQLVARHAFADAIHPTAGAFRQVAPTLAGMVRGDQPYRVPDTGVTATAELLSSAGLTRAEVDRLLDAGVVA